MKTKHLLLMLGILATTKIYAQNKIINLNTSKDPRVPSRTNSCTAEIPMVISGTGITVHADPKFTYQNCITVLRSDNTDPIAANHLVGKFTIRLHDLDHIVGGSLVVYWKGNTKVYPVNEFVYDTDFSKTYDFTALPGHESETSSFSVNCQRYTSGPYHRGR